jgi:sugar phosphate isomerase/epimerase
MLSLSTSYFANDQFHGPDIVERLKALDICSLELSYKIDMNLFQELRNYINPSQLLVSSVHNFFPIPDTAPNGVGGGDIFLLSNPADDARREAVHWTKRSIEYANSVGAKALVLHCGRVEMNAEWKRLSAYYRNGQIQTSEARNFIHRKLGERLEQRTIFLDRVLRSLEELLPTAEQHHIILGIENRYHYHELPGPEEFDTIFEKFAGAPIGYWHDTGHAHAQEVLGIISENELLNRYNEQLVGMHLHDARGLDDHLPPGIGEIDFRKIADWVKEDTVKVIELAAGTPNSEVAAGIDYLKKYFENSD